ncbi:MAG: glycosyltransferase [Bacteroidales bacterium]
MKYREPSILYLHNAAIDSRAANLVQVVSMCSALAQAGYRVVLVLHSNDPARYPGNAVLQERYGCDPRVELRLVHRKIPRKLFRHLNHWWYRRIVLQEQPDLCFVRDPRYLRMVLKLGVPVILELHSTKLHLGSSLLDHVFRKQVVRGAAHRHCLKVITISKALNQFWTAAGIPGEKTLVLHDGVSSSMFDIRVSREEARATLNLPPEGKIVVYTGNLQANRGIRYILELAVSFPEITFLMVGGEPGHMLHYQAECEKNEIRNMRFEGHQPHPKIPLYLRAADILLAMWSSEVPTISYCSPLKVFEYMASGRPALFPGYPTILEVAEDGREAFIAPPDSPEGFKATLQHILDADPVTIERITGAAREKVLGQYSWKQRVKSIIDCLPEKFNPQNKSDD